MKMIKVTAASDNTAMFINIDKIKCIFVNDDEDMEGETVIETSNFGYCCTETPEEVYQKIKEIEND